MPLSFPNSPSIGDEYVGINDVLYVWDGEKWKSANNIGPSLFGISSGIPPSGASNGDAWFDTESGRAYVYYIDADSAQWIDMSPTWNGTLPSGSVYPSILSSGGPSWTASGDLTVPGTLTVTSGLTVDTDSLYVDASNNRVGIGSTLPNSPLDVVGSGRSIQFGSTTRKLYAWSDAGGVSLLTGDNQAGTGIYFDESGGTLRFSTGSSYSEKARIDSSGRLGIGTTNPGGSQSALLHVVGSGACQFTIDGTSANGSYLTFENSGTAKYFIGSGAQLGGGTVSDLALRSQTGGGITFLTNGANERMRITSSGTVNINTIGDSTFGGFSASQIYVKSTASNWTGGIHIEALGNDSVGVINHSNNGLEISQSYRSGGSYAPIIFRTSGTERLRIDTGGRVTMPNQPSFRVYQPSGAANAIITFGATEFNIGNHMDAATGIFTAPIAGRYLFTFAILCGNPLGSYVRINFCKNSTNADATLGDALWDGLSAYGSPGMAMIFNLAAYDTIGLRTEGSKVYATSYGSFSGCLIG